MLKIFGAAAAVAIALLTASPAAATVVYDYSGWFSWNYETGVFHEDAYDVTVDLGAGDYRATITLAGDPDAAFFSQVWWRDHMDTYAYPWNGEHQNWLYYFDQERPWIYHEGVGTFSFDFTVPRGYIATNLNPDGTGTVTTQAYENPRIRFFVLSPTDADYNWRFTLESLAVPEPATWAMMIVGFGLTGAAIRRRSFRRSLEAL